MITFHSLDDLHAIEDDPDLWREVFGFMSVCVNEFLQFAEPEDMEDHDFQFKVAEDADASELVELGQPEEWAKIEIASSDGVRSFYRIVFVSEVVFVPEDLATGLPYLSHPLSA